MYPHKCWFICGLNKFYKTRLNGFKVFSYIKQFYIINTRVSACMDYRILYKHFSLEVSLSSVKGILSWKGEFSGPLGLIYSHILQYKKPNFVFKMTEKYIVVLVSCTAIEGLFWTCFYLLRTSRRCWLMFPNVIMADELRISPLSEHRKRFIPICKHFLNEMRFVPELTLKEIKAVPSQDQKLFLRSSWNCYRTPARTECSTGS